MKLPADGSGVHFYDFKRIPDTMVFKNMYRARMDSLHADSATADRMVEEANYAFFLNTRIFQELDSLAGFEADPVPPPATAPPSSESAAAAAAARAAGCPFASLAAAGVAMPEGHPHPEKADSKESGEPERPAETTRSSSQLPLLLLSIAFGTAAVGLLAALSASRKS
ncbi:unnamed protein product [Durusdinium trenchii]|uniref:Uncharacterized protein n=1 Tax=Durusdinium trenchii TaxID=1381693 RepID=A0ABP0PT79_9DINO